MNKETIELEREENFPYGYGSWNEYLPDDNYILDKLIEWSNKDKNTVGGVSIKKNIYRHVIRYEHEKVGELGEFYFNPADWTGRDFDRGKVPKCHRVCYLDIYYQ